MVSEEKKILALYDCRSKQEYIYRTNRVKEIIGASMLLTDLFKEFFVNNKDFKFETEWKENSNAPENYLDYFEKSGLDGEIVYEGGGNLCIIYRNYETYIKVNQQLSKKVLEKTFGVSIIAAYTEVSGNFVEDRKKLYDENALRKNIGSYHTPCNTLPFTQVDRLTYQPIIEKKDNHQYTMESKRKLKKYEDDKNNNGIIIETEFDKMVSGKGEESLLAIIYIDGNNMGDKIKKITEGAIDYSSGISALRSFSVNTNNDFVDKPIKAIKKELTRRYEAAADNNEEKNKYLFRPIIMGGDEINIVCNARAVPCIIEKYFETLKSEGGNSSCAGIAIFHSHSPFADTYNIAEQCCENGKKISHRDENGGNNYIDFHFCHSGITNTLDKIRNIQEEKITARPYEYSKTWQEFMEYGKILSALKRSDVKALGESIIKGDSYYLFELERIKSRDKENKLSKIYDDLKNPEKAKEAKKYIFDVSIVYDLWFGKAGGNE